MIKILLQIFKGPPLWVWALFSYLIFIGIKAFKPSVVPLKKIFILPIVFLFFSLQRLVDNVNFITILLWLFATFVGASLGYVIFRKAKIASDKKNNLLKIPGTYSTLIMILISFSIKVYFGFQIGKNPNILKDAMFFYTYIIVSSITSGIFLGRTLLYFYRYNKAESTNLLDSRSL